MSNLNEQIDLLTAALKENTAAIREILAAGIVPANVVPITETAKAPAKGKAKAAPIPEPTPEPEAPAAEELEKPTKVAVTAPKESEFHDPLDPATVVVVQGSTVDPEAVIAEITDTWKKMLTEADADRKNVLKEEFPKLRTKWGLKDGEKLITIASTPENLVGLLNDIKSL